MENITGKTYVFGKYIDTDQICPGAYLELTDHKEIASHALEGARDGFAQEFTPGGIVAALENFGCGSSREHAAIALKELGVGAVVAKSFARIFFRNAMNLGLPLIVCADIEEVAVEGDILHIDLQNSVIQNTSSGKCVACEPLSDYAKRMIDAGGIKALIAQQDA